MYGQILNADFELWDDFTNASYPTHWILTDQIVPNVVEKDFKEGSSNVVLKVNPPKNYLCANDVSQIVNIASLSKNEKGCVFIHAKIFAESLNPKVTFSIENYTKDTTFINNIGVVKVENTDGYEDILIGNIHEDADVIYIFMSSGGNEEKENCSDLTTLWVDRVYIKPKASLNDGKPTIMKDGMGNYSFENIIIDDYEYSLYSIDGKLLQRNSLEINNIEIFTNGVYILQLYNTPLKKTYSYKIVNVNY